MKLKIFYTLFFELFFFKVNSQITIDSAFIKCSYKLNYLADSTKPEKSKNDLFNLLVGTKSSCFFSYINFIADSAFTADILSGNITSSQLINNKELQKKYAGGGLYSKYILYFQNDENKIITTDKINTRKFVYEEPIEKIHWDILSDTLTILSYHCQKATANFRGRAYIAWFTQEIPVSSGPYKFQGLPGLIVNIADTKNNYVFECAGVELLTDKQPIIVQKKDCIKTTRTEFRKLFHAMFQNPLEFLTTGNNVTIGGQDADKLKAMLQKGIPYNPIELE